MGRFWEMLNTPSAVLAVVAVVVAVNGYLYFGYYLPRTTTTPAPSSPPPQTEPTTQPGTTQPTTTQPRTTLEGTVTSTTTPTSTATPSP